MSTASLFHLPRSLISSREIPLVAAETAARFLREWPEKPAVEMPARRSISLILSTRYRLLNGPAYYSFQKSGQIVQFNVAKGSCSVDRLMGGLQCSSVDRGC